MMNKLFKKILVAMVMVVALTGCTEADKVNENVSREAENFNVLRRFAVINTRTDKVEFEIIGAFSREDVSDNSVSVIVELEDGTYKKHIIGLNEDTMYIVEDLGGAKVNKYKYEVHFLPESVIPWTIKTGDSDKILGESK